MRLWALVWNHIWGLDEGSYKEISPALPLPSQLVTSGHQERPCVWHSLWGESVAAAPKKCCGCLGRGRESPGGIIQEFLARSAFEAGPILRLLQKPTPDLCQALNGLALLKEHLAEIQVGGC